MFVAGSIFNFRFLSEIRGWNGIYDMVIKRIWHFNHSHHTHHIIPWLGTVYGYIQNRCPSCKSLISCFLPCQGSPCTKMTSEDPHQRPGQTTQQSSQRARQRSSYLQAVHVGNLGPTLCPRTYGGRRLRGRMCLVTAGGIGISSTKKRWKRQRRSLKSRIHESHVSRRHGHPGPLAEWSKSNQPTLIAYLLALIKYPGSWRNDFPWVSEVSGLKSSPRVCTI